MEYRRHLPHIHPQDAWLFLTWRLAGSLPAPPPDILYATPGHAFAACDRALDCCRSGPLWLQDSRIARLITDTLHAGEERKFYELRAWVVMPNHVHVLLPRVELPVITRWLKGSTARRANQLLGRTGQAFWQDESYDRWVRTREEMERIVRYIERNPVSAGLAGSVEAWPWSSAGQAKSPVLPG